MKKGFSLIEVMIAVTMIALLVLVISGIISISIKMSIAAEQRDESFNIAGSICEIYKSNSDMYSNTENEVNIYKYINSLTDIQSIHNLIQSKDGYYFESNHNEIIKASNGQKYTLILSIKRIFNNINMEELFVEVIRNDGELMKITMNAAK